MLETTNRNHSTYWIVNHWNPFKLVNIVSVILEANLNWRIYHNYNPFKLVQLEENHTISVIVHLWFEVLNWYWIFEWLDLPNLQSIINSKGGSFRWPYSVTAKDTSGYWILIVFTYSKPSKWQAIWVIPLCTILINFEYSSFDWFDSIHRCVFHSHYLYPLIQVQVISALNHTLHSMIIEYSMHTLFV